MKLWLDDIRDPKRYGYHDMYWAKNYNEAIAALKLGKVTFASLDHDIGACEDCVKSLSHIGDMRSPETTFFNHCSHEKSGYDVICFMEDNDIWPTDGVKVHSMNPVGKERMNQVIRKQYGRTW